MPSSGGGGVSGDILRIPQAGHLEEGGNLDGVGNRGGGARFMGHDAAGFSRRGAWKSCPVCLMIVSVTTGVLLLTKEYP